MEDKNKHLTCKIHESTNEVSFHEKTEGNALSPTIGDTDKGRKSLNVSFCKQTRSNALSSTSPTVYNTKRRTSSEDQNGLDKDLINVGSKGSDKVTRSHKICFDNLCDGITNSQKDVLVNGTEPKGSGTVRSSNT